MLQNNGYIGKKQSHNRTFYFRGKTDGERQWYQILEFDFSQKPLIHTTPLRFVIGYDGVFLSRSHEVEGKLLHRGRLFDSMDKAQTYLAKYIRHTK